MKFRSLYKIAAVCCAAALFLTACYSDKGNYDYHDINEVTIEGIDRENVYQAYAFQTTLKISPVIHSTMSEADNYEYTWRIIPRNADTNSGASLDEFIVSREKDLVYPVQLSDGDYTGFFEVKDPATGVTWIEDFYLHVTSQGSNGWLVACDDNGRTRLDLIGKDSEGKEDVLYPDLWKNLDFDMGSPKRLFFVGDNWGTFGLPFLATDKGSFAITGSNFHIGEDTDLKWYFGTAGDQILIESSVNDIYTAAPNLVAYWWVINNEGEIYKTECSNQAFFSYPINMVNGETAFKAAPFIGVSYSWWYTADVEPWNYNYAVIFYDMEGRRFLSKYDTNNYPSEMQCTGTQLFDVVTGRDMVFMDSHYDIDELVVAVLKEPASPEYYLYGMLLKFSEIEQFCYGKIEGPDMANAKFFALHPSLNVLFYATENKVYRIDIGNQTTMNVTEVLALDPGEEIVVCKFNKILYIDGPEGMSDNMYKLVVCTNKKMASPDDPNVGTFRLYEVPEFATDKLTLAEEIDGLGKIVDVVYKEYEEL